MSLTVAAMWQDRKVKLLFFGVVLVAVFQVPSLSGVELPHVVAFPVFLAIILLIGHRTILDGFRALLEVNFKSILLLMVIEVIGAIFLGEYEEAAIVIGRDPF